MFEDYRKRPMDKGLEEAYKRLFPYIARDFVAKEDVRAVIDKIIEELDPRITYDKELSARALEIAKRYRDDLGD